MLAMPGLRAFSLSSTRDSAGVSCDANGVFVGGVPLLKSAYFYRLPIDISAKAGALALIANAFNRGDFAMAAIATVQMQFPDPPPLVERVETSDAMMRRAAELHCSRLLKVYWDPARHPRAGTPPNPGWFAPVEYRSEPPSRVAANGPFIGLRPIEGEGEGSPDETLEFSVPGGGHHRLEIGPTGGVGLPRSQSPGRSPPAPRPTLAPEPKFPFEGGLPPKLAPYVPGGKTSGILDVPGGNSVELQSGYDGPAKNMPPQSPGFDLITKSHVEGHAAAIMRQEGIPEATLRINNPEICDPCSRLLPRMLPPGAVLRVVLPDGTVTEFKGVGP